MKVCAIIAEYNPFHNGHKRHLELAKEKSGATHTLAVMSGGYVQRGEIALLDKWTRAKMAVMNGVDLVLELPVCFSSRSAEFYAKYNISIINRLGAVDCLAFGCECDDEKKLGKIADILTKESGRFAKSLKKYTDEGNSFAKARGKAIGDVLGEEYARIIDKPNNTLAVEYMKALKREVSKILPVCIKREGADHDAEIPSDDIASASYIRKLIADKKFDEAYKYIPKESAKVLKNAILSGEIADYDKYRQMIVNNLMTKTAEDIECICDVREGIENRIVNAVRECADYGDLIDRIKTKRYTRTNIERILLNTVMGITKDYEDIFPPYVKVLAFNDKGREILAKLKDTANIPVITKPSATGEISTPDAKKVFAKEIMAQEIYSRCMKTRGKVAGELKTSPHYVK